MKIDAEIHSADLSDIPSLARAAERCGFDCLWVSETKHDPFIQLALASAETRVMSLGTSIALAFTRSPTSIAYSAWDLQNLSGGRLILGLGSQVKGHVERRFGMKWEEPPAAKMKDVIGAVRAVWDSWQNRRALDYRGRFFRLDLMTPFFNPGPIGNPEIPIYVAGVNRGMCTVAGAAGDGLHVHPLHTVRYLKEVVVPALQTGLKTSGRARRNFSTAVSTFAAAGETEEEIRILREYYRSQLGFYASTRTYRNVMELHGWGDLCDRLHELSVRGQWDRMGAEVPEEVLNAFVVEGSWKEIGEVLRRRYRGIVDRVRLYKPFDAEVGWKSLVESFGT